MIKVLSLQYAVLETDREHAALQKRAETAEKASKLALEHVAAVEASSELQETPKGHRNKSLNKRDQETPREGTKGNNRIEEGRKPIRDEGRSKKNRQELRSERHMEDAKVPVKANDQKSYAEIL